MSRGNSGVESGGGNVTMGDGTVMGTNNNVTWDQAPPPVPTPTPEAPHIDELDPDRSRNVFVVHGRDEQARLAMFGFLRRLDLNPQEWESLVAETGEASPYLGQVVATATGCTQAALVLLTPDDVVRLHPDLHGPRESRQETEDNCQARPNVILELGMVLIAYPKRTVIVEIGDLRPIADLGGLNVIRFDGTAGCLRKIGDRLRLAGCKVNDVGSDWLDTKPFADLDAYDRRPR
jgi:predicted nucleotide-binding protein